MLVDYAEILSRLEQALGRHFAASPSILNVPGVSAALKLDPFYYLALRPAFGELLGKWAGVTPSRAEETLSHTGNLVLGPRHVRYPQPLAVYEEGTRQVLKLAADFVPAEWIDRAVVMYGGQSGPLPVAGLRLVSGQKAALDAFFAGKTPLAALAFGDPAGT
uniref:Uncharacterized protein n=1 Tax=Desulfovibrio sp. U5L TaxID=596152 RepID=I2PXP5_9BACT